MILEFESCSFTEYWKTNLMLMWNWSWYFVFFMSLEKGGNTETAIGYVYSALFFDIDVWFSKINLCWWWNQTILFWNLIFPFFITCLPGWHRLTLKLCLDKFLILIFRQEDVELRPPPSYNDEVRDTLILWVIGWKQKTYNI